MTSDSLRHYCLSFPEATEKLQWGDQLCFKVRGKIFLMLGLDSVPQRLCFKCTPETFAELVEREGIIPAPYVGRYQWVMVEHPDTLPNTELEDLIRHSYEMVASKAPRKSAKRSQSNRSSRRQRSRGPKSEV